MCLYPAGRGLHVGQLVGYIPTDICAFFFSSRRRHTMLALVRNVATGGPGVIDRIDFNARRATQLPSLGIFTNSVNPAGVLAPAPNGGSVLVAMPDGDVMLYDANADTFTVSRQGVKNA